MIPKNILTISSRDEFRKWLMENHEIAAECWVEAKRGKKTADGSLWYIDAVEEALCFGWIDSTVKKIDGVTLQRFGKRVKGSQWTELNKERCRRLEAMGLMTDSGRKVCPDLSAEFEIHQEIINAFKKNTVAWTRFKSFHPLYQRVRIDNIQRHKTDSELFRSRLQKLIDASENGEMIGAWNDYGRLLDY
ncbi:MAG: YdeI/OmpD-associated family protein [Bacteroides sp.]|nr:YdeI/OmpD-associated family protein [Bacteroides sp.]MCM1390998.1 YdeI/OmpD-associated family protein [Bacteroides sp.]